MLIFKGKSDESLKWVFKEFHRIFLGYIKEIPEENSETQCTGDFIDGW